MGYSPVEQRNFYLTLSVLEGQQLAHSAGFSVPSPEVQESELLDIIQRWITLSGIGALESIKACSNWMLDMLEDTNEWEAEEKENINNIIVSFGVGLLSHLIDSEIVLINPEAHNPDNLKTNFTDFMGLFLTIIPADDYDEDEDEDIEDE